MIRELSAQLRRALQAEGYLVVDDEQGKERQLPPRDGPTTPPSRDVRSVEWKAVEQRVLVGGEARSAVEMKEVTLRLENEMGLYETRSGLALVVKTEIGGGDGDEEEEF